MSSDILLKPKLWRVLDHDQELEEELPKSLGISRLLGRILVNRGITNLADAKRFLQPSMDDLHDPYLLDGMDLAVSRTRQAIDGNEPIMV